jgi:GNAT superfamily N-acetyltransferase
MDMLFQLSRLPSPDEFLKRLSAEGITIRRAMAYERHQVMRWVEATFGSKWSAECAVAFGHQPIGCWFAVHARRLCGFCCSESTYLNFLGPIGVADPFQKKGVGRALVLSVLTEMRFRGYAYAIVGDVGAPDFFTRAAGAVEVPGSSAGASYPEKLS